MKIIAIEEHLSYPPITQQLAKYMGKDAPYMASSHVKGRSLEPDLRLFFDAGAVRIEDMDQHGIHMQILSCPVKSQLLPPEEAPSIVRETNDYFAEVVRNHPDRFGAFGLLPWSNVEEAVRETERIKELGFHGVMLMGRASAGPAFLDDHAFLPILEACNALYLPIFIHPGAPLQSVQEPYYGGLGEEVSARLSLHGWGWHNEAGIQILRTILAGRFQQLPNLQLIAGHWGEMVPFFLSRLDQSMPPVVTKLERTITETFRQHVYVTPSGMFDYPQLKFCAEVLGTDRIIHSVDCPFVSNAGAKDFIDRAPLAQEEKEKIAFRNAQRLFHL